MITNGKNRAILGGNLPNMSQIIVGWFQPITFGVVTTTLVDFEKVENIEYVDTNGVVQPPRPEAIEIQPEGIRNWEWLEVHCLPNLQVNINEFIIYNGLRYKVMQKENFSAYGYVKYLILEAYRGERANQGNS